ncbi:hypothetical protein AB0F77_23125 [Streptomyces sp. NPDC026672]|uniref:hypothetical protein n=1 Tax=unclassified Streptomyces TaxID=2593676 RepID=UPI0033ECB115
MIKHITHPESTTTPTTTCVGPALDVAHELHVPAPPKPPATIPPPQLMGLRLPAEHPHVRKVSLRRLTALRH